MVSIVLYKASLVPSSSPDFTGWGPSFCNSFGERCLTSSSASSTSREMARQGSGALMGRNRALVVMVVVVVMAAALLQVMVSPAYGQQPEQQCNLKTLVPCLKTVKGPYPPQPDQSCCGAIMNYNPACVCSEFVDSKDYPQSFIKNVLAIPKACGRYQLSGYRCGSKPTLPIECVIS